MRLLHVNMTLLRVSHFVQFLHRYTLLAECCQRCLVTRSGAIRRLSDNRLHLQRKHVSMAVQKTEDAKKRVLKQSQLLNVLEARIQQLQCDGILEVQKSKVDLLQAPSSARRIFSGENSRNTPAVKADIPKLAQKSQPSPWMEKLTLESKNKLKTWNTLKQKMKKKVTEKPKEKQLNSQVKHKHPATAFKTISTPNNNTVIRSDKISTVVSPIKISAATTETIITESKSATQKKHSSKKKHSQKEVKVPCQTTFKTISTSKSDMNIRSDKMSAGVSPVKISAATAGTIVTKSASQKKQKTKKKESKKEVPSPKTQMTAEELARVKELERKLSQKVHHLSYLGQPKGHRQGAEFASSDLRSSIVSYLETCVFAGNIDLAEHFLLSQHKRRSRRALLNTDVYNIMMRVWAKKGILNPISSLFILLEEAGLRPNAVSYSAALECMGRSANCPPQLISRCLSHMKQDGLSLDDIFSQCVFQLDERDMVLKAVHTIHPDYQPAPAPALPAIQSYSSLVEDFYEKRYNHQYPKLDFTREELQERFKFQFSMEQACTVTIDSVEADKPITENMAKMRALLVEQRAHWRKVLLQAWRESKMVQAKTNTMDFKLNLYPYFCVLEDSAYVDIMIQSVASIPPSGESLLILAKGLGTQVYTKYLILQKCRNDVLEKLGNIYNAYIDLLAKDTKVCNVLPREQWSKLEAECPSGPTLQGCESSWPDMIILELGTYLLDLMVNNLKINSDILNPAHTRKRIPILYHMYTFRSTRQIGFIKPHPILTQMQQEATETHLTFDSYVMPMRCPPVPWTSAKLGAYLMTPTKLMRTIDGATQHYELLERCQNLHAALDSLNQLGNCAWKINKPVLDIIISIFNDRGSDKLDIPPPLSEAPKVTHFNPKDASLTASEKAQLKREVVNARKKCSEMHSLRMDALYKLSIANHIRDEVFWFPHNMDFRGRTYPCPPYFNHLGNDVTRSVLLFAEGKPLGPKGLDWLKIHLVNLTGLKKKSSLQGRLEYANSIMEDILDSADNPMNGKKWWMDADELWQTLACCMEIANAVRSPDPAQFISHFPVQQDGSCNGLQHYAALGRDIIGATSVNLVPCDLPQDVYSGVAQQVEEFRARDAESGLKIAQILEGFISRKVVKQTVMTVVYGVTRYGGRLQIEKRLKEIDEFPKMYVWEASHYLVRQVFSGLKEMFTGTREIQDWLTESARLISKTGHSVQWVTPLGLPIIQPYHRARRLVLKSTIQQLNIPINHDTKQKPDTMKQKNAFPPNFIHSLDSTHMMLTALHSYSYGLTFVSVHDCFWTHALTVDTMNKVCREQFVALHSQPILQELSDYLLHIYCTDLSPDTNNKKYLEYQRLMLLLAKVPQTGDLDLNQVNESTYFFS
ncbi:DNA-directed RNA polymerase, mitochondrial [Nerophis lumbriciformis]|uniref:DNA-directed RNA polymerase, mitochondrial n=1 Tax=Nerophis lumbriciformis TaxID=546530 RepID=UPI002ADF9BB8|nr:DNA-directed RNA polymerase, mitochondrial-like [Nerophis lumbriciformis]